mgnify:CR=1 FL=1
MVKNPKKNTILRKIPETRYSEMVSKFSTKINFTVSLSVHFYNYLVNSLVSTTYPIPRFASEYGYQSLPDADTWLTVTDDVDNLDPGSVFMYHRQHHVLGFAENSLLIGYQLNLNKSIPDYYKTYIFYSQIVQALSIKFETEYYRSFMGRVDSEGRGNTMGALFWQLNDVWVAPTWSGIGNTMFV